MLTVLLYIILWLASGMLCNLLKIFVFFRGVKHMMDIYLSHPKYRANAIRLLEMAIKDRPKDITGSIVFWTTITSAIFAPLALIDLILDVIRFFNYTPPIKQEDKTNEQK